MRCCLGAVGWTCHAGLYWEVSSPGRLPRLPGRSLVLRWKQQSSSAAPIVCYGRLSSAARVVPGEQQRRVAGQSSGAVVLEFLGEHDRGSGVALVCGACHRLVLVHHVPCLTRADWLGWVCCCYWRGERLEYLRRSERFSVAVWVRWSAAPHRMWLQSQWCCCGDLLPLSDGNIDHLTALGAGSRALLPRPRQSVLLGLQASCIRRGFPGILEGHICGVGR